MPARLTTEEWIRKAESVHGKKYDYSFVEHKLQKTQQRIICPVHGEFTQTSDSHLHYGCNKCGITRRAEKRSHSFARFKELSTDVHDGYYSYPVQDFVNTRGKVSIECPVHGLFEQVAYRHLAGRGCKKCGYERNGRKSMIGVGEFIHRATEKHGTRYKYVGKYNGMHSKTDIQCREHGVFKQTPHNHLKGADCPKCVGSISKQELEVAGFLESLGIVVEQTRKGILRLSKSSLDMYLPDHNVAIEYNGLYWHSEKYRDKYAHREKTDECDKKGITLINMFSDEWVLDKEKTKLRLRGILGLCEKYDARKCELGTPSYGECREFLELRHMQGAGSTFKYAYGLYYSGVLVSLITFGRGRFNNDGWEILRYASDGRVRGGISRLIKAFKSEYSPNKIVSYADMRWGSGNAYGAVGFTLDSITEPDYWWTDGVMRISRYKMQPHKIGMSEAAYAKENGLSRIYGVGHKKWVWNKE